MSKINATDIAKNVDFFEKSWYTEDDVNKKVRKGFVMINKQQELPMRKNRVVGGTYDEERAFYNLRDTEVAKATFAGPADGESAFKEARDITVRDCLFSLRYPFWHARRFAVVDCILDNLTRAPIWYAEDGLLAQTKIEGVKCLRECRGIALEGCTVVSPEFGWRCWDLDIRHCDITSEYFLFECRDSAIDGLTLHGKYSFQYTENVTVENSELDTKDAFWHAKNVTVKNCTVKGEYLGWYSEGLTLENCHIAGTQPLCYCKALKLINCTMEGTDLSFEYSDVEADISGHILSVKNPHAGYITADGIGEIIHEDSVMENTCQITVR